ncbi:MAG TPA: alpha/beta hydrolase [Anaerolineales bacterium]|nr:alpha/beta hydrolase [Anaerolineales bacterium]
MKPLYNQFVQKSPSQIIKTSRGAIEYALHNPNGGATVILCHSTGGGYDQGLVLAQLLDGFQGIAVSRAGYLRTPVETGASPAELADAYEELLDSLEVEKAAILGLSGGGMSAAHFAFRHSDRCWGLVLADAITKAPPKSSARIVATANSLPDGIAWLLTRLAIYIGLPLMVRDAETRSMMRVFFENNPISERRAGVRNDLMNVNAMNEFPWEEICVPTLLIHGDKDNLIPVEYSREVARRISNAELVIVKGGGHECLVSHQREVAPMLNSFLKKYISSPPDR